MRNSLFLFFIMLFCFSCTEKKDSSKEILIAENQLDFRITYNLTLYSDSMYLFTFNDGNFNHEKNEKFRGRYLFNKDTIIFTPFQFDFLDANKAVIKNNFVEFLDGKYPFKIKVLKTSVEQKLKIDTTNVSDFALFTYNPKHYSYFSDSIKPYDLNKEDLITIDSLLAKCIAENNGIGRKKDEYFKQCTAIINSRNEKEVRIYCLCKKHFFKKEEYQYQIIRVNDGGDCFFSVKMNLTRRKYYDLHINGLA